MNINHITTVEQADARLTELWEGPHTKEHSDEYYAILEVWYDRVVAYNGYLTLSTDERIKLVNKQDDDFNQQHKENTVMAELQDIINQELMEGCYQ